VNGELGRRPTCHGGREEAEHVDRASAREREEERVMTRARRACEAGAAKGSVP
jgi:hypothetical protein